MSLSICMVSDDFLPAMTGVGVHLKLICPELVRRGHRVSVVTTRRPGEPAREVWQGVEVYRVFTLKAYGFYQAIPSRQTVRNVFASCKPSLIHHHYVGFMMAQVCAVAKESNLPQISTFHFSAEVLTQPLLMRPLRPLIRRLMVAYNNRFDVVVSPSKNLVRTIREEGVRTEIRYISNPVAFGETDGVEAIQTDGSFAVLYAGRLGPEKNIGYLIRAFGVHLRKFPGSVLWIAGKGPEQQALESLVAELAIGKRVAFLGFLDHATLARYYKACDVFVLPSLQEAQPLVAMEAMWFGRPVIVTSAIVAAEEMVSHGENGFIVDPSDSADLANRLDVFANSPDMVNAYGHASLKMAQAYRIEVAVGEIEAAYLGVQ